MFIRKKHKTDPSTGKKYFSYQLIESYRAERGPRQRVLLNLGSDLPIQDDECKLLANRIEELRTGGQTLFPYPEHIEKLAQTYSRILSHKDTHVTSKEAQSNEETDYQTVDLNTLEHSYARSIGLEHLALETIKKLELDQTLSELGLTKRETQVALGLLVGKLCFPTSELGTHHWLQCNSSIDELLGTDFSRLSLNAVYKVADNLLKHKEAIEKQLESKEQDLFCFTDTIVLYDLTNTYFEGRAEGIQLAARGKSKERRSDCPLVTLGLVLNSYGFPKRSCVLPGNISEPKTLEQTLKQLSGSCQERPVIVLDAGIATADNLDYLREHDYRYIVASRSRSCNIPDKLELKTIKQESDNTVKVAKQQDQDSGEVLIYCHSESRMQKEKSMRSLKQERFEHDLELAVKALSKKGGTKSYHKVLERIGRLKERHSSVARHYKIEVKSDKAQSQATDITWEINEQGLENRYQGAYLLKAYGLDWSSERFWKTYIMLTKVEEGFRCLKSDLGLRPIYHQINRRVEGHLFISVIAYHIMQTILYQLQKQNICIRWKTLRQIMITQMRLTTTVKTKDGRNMKVRSSTIAEPAQKELYKALGISSRPSRTIKTIV